MSVAPSAVTRQWLQKQLQSSGIQTESTALKQLAKTLESTARPEELLTSLLDHFESSACFPDCSTVMMIR